MTTIFPHQDSELYAVALLLPESRSLLAITQADRIQLPTVCIPKGARPAEQITKAILNQWHMRSIIIDVVFAMKLGLKLALIEVRDREETIVQNGFVWLHLTELDCLDLDSSVLDTLDKIVSKKEEDLHPFLRLGWIDDVREWLQNTLSARDVVLTDDIQQMNCGGNFALLRLVTTDGRPLWFKATGVPNLHEFPVTMKLCKYFAEYMPSIVASHQNWNAWVMEDAGQPSEFASSTRSLGIIVSRLANLQKASIAYVETLQSTGCFDHRIPVLHARLEDLIDYLSEAMQRQTSTKMPPIEKHRLHEIGSTIRDVCGTIQGLRIPNTLNHNDINAGNILFDGKQYRFTDWAEACIGNPFITFHHVCVQICRFSTEPACSSAYLHQLYRACWREWLTDRQIDLALVLMPVVALVSHLYGRGIWLNTHRSKPPANESYMRSVARLLDKATQDPVLRRSLCQ